MSLTCPGSIRRGRGVGGPKSDPPPEVLSKYSALYASYQAAYPECRFFDGCYAYDAVIRALGWHFDTGVFGDAARPALVGAESSKEVANDEQKKAKKTNKTKMAKEKKEKGNQDRGGAARIVGKYPAMTPHYESVNVPGLFFAGALAHSLDYKKAAGGFIHGFRYTAQAMVRDLLRRFHGQSWEVQDLKSSVAAVVKAVVARLRSSSSLWQMYGVIGDVVLLTSPAPSSASSASGSDDADYSDPTSSTDSDAGSSTRVPPTALDSVNFKYVKDVPIAMLNTPEFVASLLPGDGVHDRGGGGGGGGDGAAGAKGDSASSSSSPRRISYVTVVFEWGAASYGPQILNEPGGQNKFLHPVMRLHGPLAKDLCKSPLRKLRGNSLNGEAEERRSASHINIISHRSLHTFFPVLLFYFCVFIWFDSLRIVLKTSTCGSTTTPTPFVLLSLPPPSPRSAPTGRRRAPQRRERDV